MPRTDVKSAEVRSKPPPAALMRFISPLMRALIRSPLGRRMQPLAVLRFTGRRTGKRRAIPVGVHDIDGVACVFTDRPWRLNFRPGIEVVVEHGGQRRLGRAELIDDPALVGPTLARAVETAGARKLGLFVAKDHQATAEELAAVGRSLIEIRFAD
ncbi:MAG: hypothetical protein QOD38_381 [Acidimicrobiaceae bacterium]|jgi:hypothetical protein